MDNLSDYALATLFLHITNLPAAGIPPGSEELMVPLRSKLLMWAAPLAQSAIFNPAAIDKIREGSGIKDSAADLVALASLYDANWERVKNMCGVTKEDVDQSSNLGMAILAALCRDEGGVSSSDLRVAQSFTLMDRAYTRCRAFISFVHVDEDDCDIIAPSLRRNAGRRGYGSDNSTDTTASAATTTQPQPSATTSPTTTAPIVGGNSKPFLPR
jgi:hypothetical protein